MAKAAITVVFHMEYEVLDRDEAETEFFIEENHCLDNVVRRLYEKIQANPGYCQTCRAAQAYVGVIPFKEIGALERIKSDTALRHSEEP